MTRLRRAENLLEAFTRARVRMHRANLRPGRGKRTRAAFVPRARERRRGRPRPSACGASTGAVASIGTGRSREPREVSSPLSGPSAGMPEEVGMAENELVRVVAPGRMLERETELAALKAVLDAGRRGEGRLVVVEGSAGIGKTRLLGAARELALGADLEVLGARGG